jgi:hypothetical protein
MISKLCQGRIVIIPRSPEEGNSALMMSLSIYRRAKKGDLRTSKLRNPVMKEVIDGRRLVFTRNEWKKVKEVYYADREILIAMSEEIRDKASASKRTSKYRDLRAIIDANTFAARELENHHKRVRPAK